MFILETERDRAIFTKFLTRRVSAESTGIVSQKKSFPATFGGHLEFLRKMQKRVYIGNGARQSNFDKIFHPQGICRVYWHYFAKKNVFPPLLVAILNFYVKQKKSIYLRNGAI